MPPFAAHSTCSLLWLRFFDGKVSVFPFANLSCQIQTYLLLEVFIKVTNDLVTFHGEDNVILSVFQRCYVLDAQSLPDVFLRANVCNFRESVDSREFFNFFIFCPHNLYSTLISKITLKLVTVFYFFLNRAKFEKRQIGALSSMKLAKIKHFLRART